ncbi:MAG: YybH family protein [Planctomycetia bacterium]
MKRLVTLVLASAAACPILVAGCSSRPIETGMSGRGSVAPTAASQAQRPSASGHRPVRPIPEVIAKSKPFRFSQPRPAASPRTLAVVTAAAAAPLPSSSGPDVAGITDTMRSYLQAFNRHDAAALASHWSTAGENIDLDSGETTSGREAVRDVFAALFEEDSGATIDIDIASIRQIRDDGAVVDGASQISFTDAPPSSSRFSAVLVRQAGNWVLDTVRESTAPRQAAPVAKQAPPRPLDALAWLVGSWEDTSEGVTASAECYWSTNKAFLIRTHVVSADAVPEQRPAPGDSRIPGLLPAGPVGSREITEIIGWDEDRGRIRSWFFSSAGRFAEGTWSNEGNAWTVRIDAASGSVMAADPTAPPSAGDCLYTLTRMDRDDMACRLNTDRLADILPPACDYARTARPQDESPASELP